VSPRPPDFNHVFAADARHDFSSFQEDCVVTVRIAAGADLRLPTGRLIASQPGAGDEAFVQRVPPGTYPVELIMAEYQDPEDDPEDLLFMEVAAARLRVRDEPVASWRMAVCPGQDETELGDDDYFGYPVDGGRGSFGSPEVYEAMADITDPHVFWPEIDEVDDVGVYVDEETGANLVCFASGDGDGHYGTWVGYTAGGEVACFLTDFMTLTGHTDEDDCGYCESSPQGPKPAGPAPAPARPLSGPASYAAGALMLVGQTLRRQSLTSPSGSCTLVYQDDGNLVLYRYDLDHAVWASNTYGTSVGELALQTDGNLVLYNRDGHAVWATGTDGRPAARLSVRDEGTVVLQAVDGSELWSAPIKIRTGKAEHPSPPGTTMAEPYDGPEMVEPYGGGTGFRFKIRNVSIDSQGDTVHVHEGGSHQLNFDVLHDCRECGSAINQVIVGLAGEDHAQACVWNGMQRSGDNPWQAEWVSASCDIVVPGEPGTYSVRARYAQAYNGKDALGWWKIDRPDGPGPESTIGTIVVE
jgi:hypothetical protein